MDNLIRKLCEAKVGLRESDKSDILAAIHDILGAENLDGSEFDAALATALSSVEAMYSDKKDIVRGELRQAIEAAYDIKKKNKGAPVEQSEWQPAVEKIDAVIVKITGVQEASVSMYKGMSAMEYITDMYKAIGEEIADIRGSLKNDIIATMRSKGVDEDGKKFVTDDMGSIITSAENIIKTAKDIQTAVKSLKAGKQE